MSAEALWQQLREEMLRAQAIGAIGAAPIDEHFIHAAAFLDALDGLLLDSAPRIVDLGSGAGLPGLVIAALLPAAEVVLLEGRTVRAEQLADRVDALGLAPRVEVLSARAEVAGRDPAWRGRFDVAVARGFAAPGVTAECAAPLLRVGGLLCVSEPPDADSAVRWPAGGCAEVGLVLRRGVTTPPAMVVLEQVDACAERYPRRVGIPSKRPLF